METITQILARELDKDEQHIANVIKIGRASCRERV